MSAPPKAYAVGDEITIWITARIGDYRAEILRLDSEGQPDRLKVTSCPAGESVACWPTLKPGDFIVPGDEGAS